MSKREYKPLVIVLKIIDVKTDEVEKVTVKTIDSADRRKWISDTVLWATLNNKYVEIINKDEDDE